MLLKHCGIPWLSMVLIYISVYRTNRIILCLMCSPNSHGHPAWTPAITPQGPTENIHTVRQPQGSPIPGPGLFDILWMGGEKRMRGYWGVKKERERDYTCLCTHKSCFLFLQVVIRRALTLSTHMEHFEESDSMLLKGTWCGPWVSDCAMRSGFHRMTCCEVHNLAFRI